MNNLLHDQMIESFCDTNHHDHNLMIYKNGFCAGVNSLIALLEEALAGLKAAQENFIHSNDELISKIELVVNDNGEY